MTHAFLIARQEFIKYVTRRGFWLSILMFPLWIMIVIFVPQWTGGGHDNAPHALTIVDRSGGFYRDAILQQVAQDTEDRELAAAAHYAAAFVDFGQLPRSTAQMLAKPDTVQARRAYRSLGMVVLVDEMTAALKPGAPFFGPPGARFIYVPPSRELLAARGAALDFAVTRTLRDGDGPLDIDAVVVIPEGFGPDSADGAQFWRGKNESDLRALVTDSLTLALRLAVAQRYAPVLRNRDMLTPAVIDTLSGPAILDIRNPNRAGGRETSMDSIVPIALAIILFVVSVMNSSVLLQGVVEEKSTRMIEVLLSCATPREITSGKLIGVIAVALATLLIWAAVFLALITLVSQDQAAMILTSLKAVVSLGTLPLLIVYFLCGLLIYGTLFLAIGSMASSLADAQSLLGPSMLILMLPNLLIAPVMRDPNGPLATAFSWIPIYTPFFMMLRISSHPPLWQIWATAALAVATTAAMIVWTGRIFARHVLTTERPPALGVLLRGLLGRRG